jgi:hypothetical protein
MEDNMKPKISLIITDLDNTLFDWILMWHSGFSAMLEKLVKNSGIQQKILEADIQTVFQKHGTSEYAFLIGVRISVKSHSKTEHAAHSRGKSAGRIILHQVFGMDRIARSFLCDSPTS